MIIIKNYEHGADIYTAAKLFDIDEDKIIDFSSNTNPFGLPDGVKSAIVDSLDIMHRYPDVKCKKLKESISLQENVLRDYIFCSNGAEESIFRIVNYLKPKNALIIAPTFSEYERALETVNCEIEYYMLKEKENFLLNEDITEMIDRKTDIVFICNPNNPTGTLTDKMTIEKILYHCSKTDTIVVVDECFMDFVTDRSDYAVKDLLEIYSNLIVLRAFTKKFAMAGIRLGYCMSGNIGIINGMKSLGPDWNVSTVAQIAGIAAANERIYLESSIEYINIHKRILVEELKRIGFKVYTPEANYVFFKSEFGIDFKFEMMKKGILIRNCDNYIGLDESYYRIAVKLKEQNQKLLDAFKEIIKDKARD